MPQELILCRGQNNKQNSRRFEHLAFGQGSWGRKYFECCLCSNGIARHSVWLPRTRCSGRQRIHAIESRAGSSHPACVTEERQLPRSLLFPEQVSVSRHSTSQPPGRLTDEAVLPSPEHVICNTQFVSHHSKLEPCFLEYPKYSYG